MPSERFIQARTEAVLFLGNESVAPASGGLRPSCSSESVGGDDPLVGRETMPVTRDKLLKKF